MLAAYYSSVRGGADALTGKQMVAIAEEMMEEILLRPFGNGVIAAGGGGMACGGTASRAAFARVGDYNGYQTTGICDIDGDAVPGLATYGVTVVVVPMVLGGVANSLRVTVTVVGGGQTLVLDGFRTDYGVLPVLPTP